MAVRGIPTEILLAPDSFKGTLTAAEVAAAIGRGLAAAGREHAELPVADGGEGTLTALAGPLGLSLVAGEASDPLGRALRAEFGLGGTVAVVEAAAASGLSLVEESERDAVRASSYGTGQQLVAAVRAGGATVYLAAGGSATTDGGIGAIQAIRNGGGLGDAKLVVLCDVRTPFEAAAEVFGPQKGASPEQIAELTARLHATAGSLPRDPRGAPLTGAAGGLAGGLWSAFGAELVPGAAFVLDAIGFDARMRASRAVVTGEGRLDEQSLVGKAVSEVATRARQSGVPCHAVVGRAQLDSFGLRILDLQRVLEAGTVPELEQAGRQLGELL